MKIDLDPRKQFEYNQISNHGFSFVLLNAKLQALHTPFMCKDYLQDLFWAEYTYATQSTVYGLTWGRDSIDLSPPRFPLAILGGKFDIKTHAPLMAEFLNRFEEALDIPKTVVEIPENDGNVVVCWMDKDWTESGPMLSAYSTLIRIAGGYAGGDPIEYLKVLSRPLHDKNFQQIWKPDPPHMTPDISRMANIGPKLKALLLGKRPPTIWTDSKSMSSAHNYGIMGCTIFPKEAL